MNLRSFSLALLLSSALLPRVAMAQEVSEGDKATARELVIEGFSALDRKDYATAADRFTRADTVIHAPTVTLGLARAQVGLGKLVSAQENYNRLVREALPPGASAAFTKAVEDARTELAALLPRVPSLIIRVQGDGGKVTLDGIVVPTALLGAKRPVDPGKHTVRAASGSQPPREASVTVAEGQTETITLDMGVAVAGAPLAVGGAPVPGAPPPAADAGSSAGSGRRPVGFAVLGVGVAGLAVGAITAGLAASKHSSLLQQCPGGHCSPSLQPTLQSDVDSYRTLGGIAVGGLVGGAVLAAAGVVLVVSAPKAQTVGATLTPVIGAGFVGAKGTF